MRVKVSQVVQQVDFYRRGKLLEENRLAGSGAQPLAELVHPVAHGVFVAIGQPGRFGNVPLAPDISHSGLEKLPGPDCVNALDAAVMAYLNINQVKQYLDANIYGVFQNGGILPSIIPDYACLRYYIRCDEEWKTRLAVDRVTRSVQGVADSMNVRLKVSQHLCPIKPLLMNETLLEAYERNMRALGEECRPAPSFQISTDAGDVSYRVPTLHGMLGITGGQPMELHTRAFAEATVGEPARKAIGTGVRALAGAACDILEAPDGPRRVREAFEAGISAGNAE